MKHGFEQVNEKMSENKDYEKFVRVWQTQRNIIKSIQTYTTIFNENAYDRTEIEYREIRIYAYNGVNFSNQFQVKKSATTKVYITLFICLTNKTNRIIIIKRFMS